MNNSSSFLERISAGQLCLGTCMSSGDATLTEALRNTTDFVWLDTEHGPIGIESVQRHAMALRDSGVPLIVRVGAALNYLINPVLDAGADGIVIPQIKSAEEARRAVEACRYPPEGTRGFGPRRANAFGGYGGTDFLGEANRLVMAIPQIEHVGAVEEIEAILALPGLTSILIGCNDLSGSMGLLGQPRHPRVLEAVDHVIERAAAANIPVGMALGPDPDAIAGWAAKGVVWFSLGTEYTMLLDGTRAAFGAVRQRINKEKI